MKLAIADILGPSDLAEINAIIAEMRFEDGRATAGWNAKLVKDNTQAKDSVTLDLLRERVSKALLANSVFQIAVRPERLNTLLFSRTAVGQSYGSHVDDPIMNGIRTDVSFTLFLSAPEDYDGGELIMQGNDGDESIKLPAGCVFIYPSTTLHRVAPVTRGERLVCAGWAKSFIRDAAQRELLFDLETARRTHFEAHGKTAEFDLMSKSVSNLMRMWMSG